MQITEMCRKHCLIIQEVQTVLSSEYCDIVLLWLLPQPYTTYIYTSIHLYVYYYNSTRLRSIPLKSMILVLLLYQLMHACTCNSSKIRI